MDSALLRVLFGLLSMASALIGKWFSIVHRSGLRPLGGEAVPGSDTFRLGSYFPLTSQRLTMFGNRRAEVDKALEGVDFSKNTYQIEFDTTAGKIVLDLWTDVAPGHCQNIIGLTKIGFYDGIIFHRVIPDFVIQAGCPQGRGTGGPGYTINAEFNKRLHEAGVLSMARTSAPNSAGSQFFLCLGRVPHLDNAYTGFGKTADDASLKVVLSIGGVETNADDRPLKDVKIKTGKVLVTPKA